MNNPDPFSILPSPLVASGRLLLLLEGLCDTSSNEALEGLGSASRLLKARDLREVLAEVDECRTELRPRATALDRTLVLVHDDLLVATGSGSGSARNAQLRLGVRLRVSAAELRTLPSRVRTRLREDGSTAKLRLPLTESTDDGSLNVPNKSVAHFGCERVIMYGQHTPNHQIFLHPTNTITINPQIYP